MKEMYGIFNRGTGELHGAYTSTGTRWVWAREGDARKYIRNPNLEVTKLYLVPELLVQERLEANGAPSYVGKHGAVKELRNKVACIKKARALGGLGLKEAKELVEMIYDEVVITI